MSFFIFEGQSDIHTSWNTTRQGLFLHQSYNWRSKFEKIFGNNWNAFIFQCKYGIVDIESNKGISGFIDIN